MDKDRTAPGGGEARSSGTGPDAVLRRRPAAPAAADAPSGDAAPVTEAATEPPAHPSAPARERPPRPRRENKPRPPAEGAGSPGAKSAARSAPQPQPADPREAALRLLAGVREGVSLDDQIAAGVLGAMGPADRARAQRLAAATLRLRARSAAVLAPLVARRPRPGVADLLALGVTEMLGFGAAPHGVVSDLVSLVRRQGQKGAAAAGMVNAVLRRAADGAAVWAGAGAAPLPDWLAEALREQWGPQAAAAIAAAHEAGAPIDITMKPGAAPLIEGAALLPTGSLRLPAGAQVSALPGFSEGQWWVQDAAAALPARLLDPQPGERIADLCAAPGGKTLQLAAAGAAVTAIDIAAPRLARLHENLARCGLTVEVVQADALDWTPAAPCDAVLLDAPCSATGTIRRHPELPLIRGPEGLAALTRLQAAMIDHALGLLKPGGRLVYATCSLLQAEGEEQIAAALTRHPGVVAQLPDAAALGVDPAWITPEGGLRLRPDYWPEAGGMDGFYMARLRKG